MKAFKRSSILFAGLAAIPLTIALVFSSVSANNKAAPSTVSQQNMSKYKKAYIAGGCFWCVEAHYEKVPGVIEVISGYSGGEVKNPSYKLVSSGSTKHVEAIEIIYDANKISYNDLLTELWHLIDPTDAKGSFSDRGKEYRLSLIHI